jgi:GDPmannose 4,6-dehydratase
MPQAFITGVTGQDGSYLAERLLREGWGVHALVRSPNDLSEQPLNDAVSAHVGDLGNPQSVAKIIADVEPDVIYNLAGISSVALSWQEPELTSRVTGTSVAAMLEAAWKLQETAGRPVRFLQASSSEIFGAATERPQTESTPVRPVSPYGAAKAYAHHVVGVYRGRGMLASAAILYNHESPRRPETFVTRKITAAAASISLGLSDSVSLGNLDARRDWGWAPDYVDAMARIAAADVADDYVVATGEAHTVREFVAAAFAAAGITDWEQYVKIDPRFNRPVDAPEMIGDASKLRTTLDWAPTVAFTDLVGQMVENDLQLLSR